MIFERIKPEGIAHNSYLVAFLELKDIAGAEIHHGLGLNWRYSAMLDDGYVF